MISFVPRAVFPSLDSLPRSYFLGHHKAGLSRIKTLLSATDLVIECRDYRVPLTSRNPLFDQSLAGRERLVVYTKRDLGSGNRLVDLQREQVLRKWQHPTEVLFSDFRDNADVRTILRFAQKHALRTSSLTGSRMMVVGMPNVGKSSLLNSLRRVGVGKRKAAHTGAQPGVTRKVATAVKITEGVYLLDTPGVFIPYVPDAEAMLKLALCGSVKDTIIAPTVLADYLLYHLNLVSPTLYSDYCTPTNEVMILLEAVAQKTGRLKKGGVADVEAAALWMIQRWRNGHLGRFVLDRVDDLEGLKKTYSDQVGVSVSQARKADRAMRRARSQ